MPKFVVDIGDYFEFWGQTAGEVVPVMQERYKAYVEDEHDYLRDMAITFCEWNGGNYYYHSRDALADSMIKNGLLEVID